MPSLATITRAAYQKVWWAWGILFLVFEGLALLDKSVATQPLTVEVVEHFPWELTMTFIGWLAIHFGGRYIGRFIRERRSQ